MRALALPLLLALPACTGGMMANVMPGETVEVNGAVFTVQRTAAGATVQNFETGLTQPQVMQQNASLAAERVTGCSVTSSLKDGLTNTYYLTLDCA